MLLSIIVPSYQIGSVIHCYYPLTNSSQKNNYEIIVVDDGSDAVCCDRLDAYVRNHGDTNARLLRQSHKGAGAARNTGIETAQGRYVWMVDADDYLSLRCVDALLKIISDLDGKETDLIKLGPMIETCDDYAVSEAVVDEFLKYGKDNETVQQQKNNKFHPHIVENPLALLAPQSSCLDHTTYIYRREFLCQHELKYPEDMKLNEDSLFVLHCLQCATSLIEYPTLRLYYVQRDLNSATSGRWDRMLSKVYVDNCIRFFGELKETCAAGFESKNATDLDAAMATAKMRALYDRYLYVYCRVLAVKCCPWEDILRFRKSASVDKTFYFLPNDAHLKANILSHRFLHHSFRLCCRMLRTFSKKATLIQ